MIAARHAPHLRESFGRFLSERFKKNQDLLVAGLLNPDWIPTSEPDLYASGPPSLDSGVKWVISLIPESHYTLPFIVRCLSQQGVNPVEIESKVSTLNTERRIPYDKDSNSLFPNSPLLPFIPRSNFWNAWLSFKRDSESDHMGLWSQLNLTQQCGYIIQHFNIVTAGSLDSRGSTPSLDSEIPSVSLPTKTIMPSLTSRKIDPSIQGKLRTAINQLFEDLPSESSILGSIIACLYLNYASEDTLAQPSIQAFLDHLGSNLLEFDPRIRLEPDSSSDLSGGPTTDPRRSSAYTHRSESFFDPAQPAWTACLIIIALNPEMSSILGKWLPKESPSEPWPEPFKQVLCLFAQKLDEQVGGRHIGLTPCLDFLISRFAKSENPNPFVGVGVASSDFGGIGVGDIDPSFPRLPGLTGRLSENYYPGFNLAFTSNYSSIYWVTEAPVELDDSEGPVRRTHSPPPLTGPELRKVLDNLIKYISFRTDETWTTDSIEWSVPLYNLTNLCRFMLVQGSLLVSDLDSDHPLIQSTRAKHDAFIANVLSHPFYCRCLLQQTGRYLDHPATIKAECTRQGLIDHFSHLVEKWLNFPGDIQYLFNSDVLKRKLLVSILRSAQSTYTQLTHNDGSSVDDLQYCVKLILASLSSLRNLIRRKQDLPEVEPHIIELARWILERSDETFKRICLDLVPKMVAQKTLSLDMLRWWCVELSEQHSVRQRSGERLSAHAVELELGLIALAKPYKILKQNYLVQVFNSINTRFEKIRIDDLDSLLTAPPSTNNPRRKRFKRRSSITTVSKKDLLTKAKELSWSDESSEATVAKAQTFITELESNFTMLLARGFEPKEYKLLYKAYSIALWIIARSNPLDRVALTNLIDSFYWLSDEPIVPLFLSDKKVSSFLALNWAIQKRAQIDLKRMTLSEDESDLDQILIESLKSDYNLLLVLTHQPNLSPYQEYIQSEVVARYTELMDSITTSSLEVSKPGLIERAISALFLHHILSPGAPDSSDLLSQIQAIMTVSADGIPATVELTRLCVHHLTQISQVCIMRAHALKELNPDVAHQAFNGAYIGLYTLYELGATNILSLIDEERLKDFIQYAKEAYHLPSPDRIPKVIEWLTREDVLNSLWPSVGMDSIRRRSTLKEKFNGLTLCRELMDIVSIRDTVLSDTVVVSPLPVESIKESAQEHTRYFLKTYLTAYYSGLVLPAYRDSLGDILGMRQRASDALDYIGPKLAKLANESFDAQSPEKQRMIIERFRTDPLYMAIKAAVDLIGPSTSGLDAQFGYLVQSFSHPPAASSSVGMPTMTRQMNPQIKSLRIKVLEKSISQTHQGAVLDEFQEQDLREVVALFTNPNSPVLLYLNYVEGWVHTTSLAIDQKMALDWVSQRLQQLKDEADRIDDWRAQPDIAATLTELTTLLSSNPTGESYPMPYIQWIASQPFGLFMLQSFNKDIVFQDLHLQIKPSPIEFGGKIDVYEHIQGVLRWLNPSLPISEIDKDQLRTSMDGLLVALERQAPFLQLNTLMNHIETLETWTTIFDQRRQSLDGTDREKADQIHQILDINRLKYQLLQMAMSKFSVVTSSEDEALPTTPRARALTQSSIIFQNQHLIDYVLTEFAQYQAVVKKAQTWLNDLALDPTVESRLQSTLLSPIKILSSVSTIQELIQFRDTTHPATWNPQQTLHLLSVEFTRRKKESPSELHATTSEPNPYTPFIEDMLSIFLPRVLS